jgi:general secretion pathway protein H
MKNSIDKFRARQRGVSLVELLIVLSILAMVAGVVIINAPPGRSGTREAADRFAARLDFAAQEAITKGVLIGMTLEEEGYAFFSYNRGEWEVLENKHVTGEDFASDFAVTIELKQAAKKNESAEQKRESEVAIRPDILFTPTGETTSFSVKFHDRQGAFNITLDDVGRVEVTDDDRA